MKPTQLRRYPTSLPDSGPSAATLGNFDGLHTGHQSLLRKLREHTKAFPAKKSILISFYPHPAVVLNKAPAIPQITGIRKELDLLSGYGIDHLYLFHFTQAFSQFTPEQFLQRFLLDHLKVNYLVIGTDARVGADGRGDARFIENYCSERGCEVNVQDDVALGGQRVSSRRVREAVSSGEMKSARHLLGRNFSLQGRVVRGNQLGRQLGFPTANLHIKPALLLPESGVYASKSRLGEREYLSVTNAGIRPTMGGASFVIESHLPDYTGKDFYGQRMELSFIEKIRDEQKFSSPQMLVQQIALDIAKAREILN